MKSPKQFRECVIFVLKRSSCHFLRSLNQSKESKTETNRESPNRFFRAIPDLAYLKARGIRDFTVQGQ